MMNISTSYTSDHLLDANKFEMGGLDSIKGFKRKYNKGDKGFICQILSLLDEKEFLPLSGLILAYLETIIEKESDTLIGAATRNKV